MTRISYLSMFSLVCLSVLPRLPQTQAFSCIGPRGYLDSASRSYNGAFTLRAEAEDFMMEGADESGNDESAQVDAATLSTIRFLGKGKNAIVRQGCVLIAPSNEFHHFYRKAAILVHAMGEDEEGIYVIRGLIIDHPTPFTLAEMMDGTNGNFKDNPLGESMLFRGGDKGGDGVVLIHSHEELGQSAIGMSGLYQGGWQNCLEACAEGKAKPEDFKVFFNHCEFTEDELEDLLDSDMDDESWISLEVPKDLILNGDWDRGDCWARLRNAVAQMPK